MSLGRRPLVFVTIAKFWAPTNGFFARTGALLRAVSRHFEVHVCGLAQPPDPAALRASHGIAAFIPLRVGRALTPAQVPLRVRDTIRRVGARACVFDRLELGSASAGVPAGVVKFVDTHDLISQRTDSMRAHGRSEGMTMRRAEEVRRLQTFDRVIAIQWDDARTLGAWLGPERVIVAPHPVEVHARAPRTEATRVGFLASEWFANVDALGWLWTEVWPHVSPRLRLDVFGSVCDAVLPPTNSRTTLHGRVSDVADAYAAMDLAVNPVRWGAGLKIKTVEAMAYGVPLVSTTEGARGLVHQAGRSLEVVDDPKPFAEALERLADDPSLRSRRTRAGQAFVREQLSEEACFGPLIAALGRACAV